MKRNRLLNMSERWFRFLQRLYPPDFRDEMGNAMVEAYTDRTRDALANSGKIHLIALWLRAFVDSLRNGAAERVRPAASWRRAGNWGRDVELVRRRLVCSPAFAATTIGTLAIGLGMFAVVFTAVQKVLRTPATCTTSGATTDPLWISDAAGWAEPISRSFRKRTLLSRTPRASRHSWAGFFRYGKAPIPWKSP